MTVRDLKELANCPEKVAAYAGGRAWPPPPAAAAIAPLARQPLLCPPRRSRSQTGTSLGPGAANVIMTVTVQVALLASLRGSCSRPGPGPGVAAQPETEPLLTGSAAALVGQAVPVLFRLPTKAARR